MRTNVLEKKPPAFTAEGAPAVRVGPELQLRRLVATCMLWEQNAYVDGKTVASEIAKFVPLVSPEFAAATAFEARTKQKLRHAPLYVAYCMSKLPAHRVLLGRLLPDIIQRADEISEFVSIYWSDKPAAGRKQRPLSKQVRVGLARAFQKFNAYEIAKYDRAGPVRLRDVAFLVHAKAKDAEHGKLLADLVNKQFYPLLTKSSMFPVIETYGLDGSPGLPTPKTWETELSAGADKRETFEGLMADKKLGALAFLRNMRNMQESGVERSTVRAYADVVNIERVLPFRFIAAARAVPQWEDVIEPMMLRALAGRPKIPGKTQVLLDVSGSMDSTISSKSDLHRVDAACGLAILLRELCEDVQIFSFSNRVVEIPPRRGFALRDALLRSQDHGGTQLGGSVRAISRLPANRLIVLTDEQSHDVVQAPTDRRCYLINVASERNGVGYGAWNHIDGWSEACIDYLQEQEALVTEAAWH
jgi:60 kDa SS-A/Ro ribonucleoprotein